MEYTCKDFKVGKCEGEKLVDGETIPLVLQPRMLNKSRVETLVENLKKNKKWFEEMIMKNSAVLLRGFDVENAREFNEIVEALGWDELRYVGPAPRTNVYKRVWTANEGPLSDSIYYHHEMVLIKNYPQKVIFFCETPPAEGGETPFVPSFRVTERMTEEFPELMEELQEKGLGYTFIAPNKSDASSMRGGGWEDAFGTSDRQEAQRRAKAIGMEMEWLPNGGVRMIVGPRSLTKVFEGRKGRRMWFNTINVGMHGKAQSSATMGDGTEIPEDFIKRGEEIMEEESIQFKWKKGDVLFLDNLALLHGRRVSLPPRKILVALCK